MAARITKPKQKRDKASALQTVLSSTWVPDPDGELTPLGRYRRIRPDEIEPMVRAMYKVAAGVPLTAEDRAGYGRRETTR